jgi:hypothetical protein
MTQEQKETIYKACLKAAVDMGPNLGNLSWFGKNNKDKEKKMKIEQDYGY